MELQVSADIHLQPMEIVTGADTTINLWPMERRSCWSWFADRTCELVEDPRWSSLFLKDCTPWKGLMLENFIEDCLLWERPNTGAVEYCEDEEAAETMCDELTAIPIPRSPVLLWERR